MTVVAAAPGRRGADDGADPATAHAGQVRHLVAAMVRDPSGQTSASVYETARLVALAPWLPGHETRIDWLLDRQRPDGGWGGPDGYALVPSLSAADALLAAAVRGEQGPAVALAAERAIRFVAGRLGDPAAPALPDLPATDLIVPALVDSIDGRLNDPHGVPAGLAAWRGRPRPSLPSGLDPGRLDRVRRLLRAGGPVPEKLAHALEVAGELARGAAGVTPSGPGAVGASPAATAAWLGGPDVGGASRDYLHRVGGDGPVPCASPVAVFERAWVLSILIRAGVPVAVPAAVVTGLRAAVGPAGAATGPGLPADADTTSVVLYALARLGVAVEHGSLHRYDTGAHFCTWPGEDGASVTTNAHVLDALGLQLAQAGPAARPRLAAVVDRLAGWLVSRQEADGAWWDRWHASPYYATWCAVLALADHGHGGAAREALARAVAWLLDSRRPDGSWGRWAGTAEETAYAVLALHRAGDPSDPRVAAALTGGRRWLSEWDGRDDAPALWHDKDLYRPTLIIRSAVLAALWCDEPAPRTAPAMIRIA